MKPERLQPRPDDSPELIIGEEVHDCTLAGEFDQLTDVVAELMGSSGTSVQLEPDPDHAMACKEATIAQLQAMLESLLPLGEEIGQVEKARRRAEKQAWARERELIALREQLATTSEELQVVRQQLDERKARTVGDQRQATAVQHMRRKVRRLERQLLLREGVLSRERKRHAATRDKLEERSKVATRRWREIRRLRARLRD